MLADMYPPINVQTKYGDHKPTQPMFYGNREIDLYVITKTCQCIIKGHDSGTIKFRNL